MESAKIRHPRRRPGISPEQPYIQFKCVLLFSAHRGADGMDEWT